MADTKMTVEEAAEAFDAVWVQDPVIAYAAHAVAAAQHDRDIAAIRAVPLDYLARQLYDASAASWAVRFPGASVAPYDVAEQSCLAGARAVKAALLARLEGK